MLAKIVAKLPVHWDKDVVRAGGKAFAAGHHVPVLIYPNPLNPKRYVVLNSGFTFREYDYLNNARQVPKLPDFAVIDIDVPVSARSPGGVVAAGFFTEEWGPGQEMTRAGTSTIRHPPALSGWPRPAHHHASCRRLVSRLFSIA